MARKPDQLRPTTIEPYRTSAPGSVVITQGKTKVLCTASLESELPKWMLPAPAGASAGAAATAKPAKGWVTAEYSMLPGSTPQRKKRGGDSRATEIQRLIGRCLRAAVDLEMMPGVAVTCDCDVLVADGGTRTASITGAFVALSQAMGWAVEQGILTVTPVRRHVAAVSVGIIDGKPYLDLDYELDVRAEVDMNIAMTDGGEFVEVQGTAEGAAFSPDQLDALLKLAAGGIRKLIKLQRAALR